MSHISVKATISNGKAEWEEEFKGIDSSAIRAGVQEVIDYFNLTLRPGERPRHIVSIDTDTMEADISRRKHEWGKTNLVTIIGTHGRSWDTMKCVRCGITGKRLGLGEQTTPDKKYQKPRYQYCAE